MNVLISVLLGLGIIVSGARHFMTHAPSTKSIAVLPFVDLSASNSDEYFTDGITEEIMGRLSQAGLNVAARESSFAFKGQSVETADIARTLDVDAVLEGTIRRAGNNARATVTLFDATTRSVIWSDTLHGAANSAFALQDELSASIVTRVNALLVE